jgi:hypothetical protein
MEWRPMYLSTLIRSPQDCCREGKAMNKHLQPVFDILLPGLERAEIEYWVYGGIGIAAFVGEFIRENGDVDIFVKETAFEDARSVLSEVCNQDNFRLKSTKLGSNQKPKLEVIDKKEILSVVPVYPKANVVEFRFKNASAEHPNQILQRVERNFCDCRFFTPPDEYIKRLFIDFLTLRPGMKKRKNIRVDAKTILTPGEFEVLFSTEKTSGSH